MITQNGYSKQCIGRKIQKVELNFNPGLVLIGLSGTGPRSVNAYLHEKQITC